MDVFWFLGLAISGKGDIESSDAYSYCLLVLSFVLQLQVADSSFYAKT
jgi:hypothetical protein